MSSTGDPGPTAKCNIVVVEDFGTKWLSHWVAGGESMQVEDATTDIDEICGTFLERIRAKTPDMMVVCADWKPMRSARRFSQHGVTLLKHLRLTPEMGALQRMHVVLFSFEPVEELLQRRPGDLILLSRGVTVLRLPEGLVKLRDPGFLALKAKQLAFGGSSDLHPYVASDYVPPDSDHAISNWWGVRQLTRGISWISNGTEPSSLPSVVGKALNLLENKKAIFLSTTGEESFNRKEAKAFKDDLTKLRRMFFKEDGASTEQQPKIVYVDDEALGGWAEALHALFSDQPFPEVPPPWFHWEIGSLASASNSPDDWEFIANNILNEDPDLILIDLRLLGNVEARIHPRKTSGAQLVLRLRETVPAVPILLVTASNKVWTFQESIAIGVDGYWMKEGIGDHTPPAQSLSNASSLIRLCRVLLGEDYQLLRKLHKEISQFQRSWNTLEPPWWKKADWKFPSPPLTRDPQRYTEPQEEEVFGLLRKLVSMYREYLRIFYLRYGGEHLVERDGIDRTRAMDFWLRSIVLQVGRIVEAVHCFRDLEPAHLDAGRTIGGYWVSPDHGASYLQKMRRDWFGLALYDFRNLCAHVTTRLDIVQPADVRTLLAGLGAWLRVPPTRKDDPMCRQNGRFYLLDCIGDAPDLGDAFRQIFGSSNPTIQERGIKVRGV